MRTQRGGVGALLLSLILGALLVCFLLYRFNLGKGGAPAQVIEEGGVKIQRSIQSVEQANKLIQDTKSTLEDQSEKLEKKLDRASNPER